jgi:hypothetical protein
MGNKIFKWLFNVILAIIFIILGACLINVGINFKSTIVFDVTKTLIIVSGIVFAIINVWDLTVLFNILLIEYSQEITLSGKILTVRRNNDESQLFLKDIKEIDYFETRNRNSRLTGNVEYLKFTFKTSEQIIITSYNKNMNGIKEFFSGSGIRINNKERSYYKLIK